MATAPSPEEIYEGAKQEGRRRLGMSTLDLVATGFIAGFTIVFGVVGLGVVESHLVGFFVALGPFDHVVVSAVHLLFGVWFGQEVGYGDVAANVAVSVPGNLVGGLVFVTLTHVVQARAQ